MTSPELDDWGKMIVKDLADLSGMMSEEEVLNILNNNCKGE